jgi:Domain of unknown function (DUF4349)
MDRFDDDTLIAELRELRPTPRPEFAVELDRRVGAGFPRADGRSAAMVPFAMLANWWRGLNPPKRLIPALGMALTVLVVATVVVSISQSGGGPGSIANSLHVEHGVNRQVAPAPSVGSTAAGAEAAEGGAGEAGGGAAESEEAEGAEESAPVEEEAGGAAGLVPFDEAAPEAQSEKGPEKGANSNSSLSALNGRDIERSAYIVLGTKPGEVSAAAAKVYSAVHAADGVVLRSSVQSGNAGATGASFALLIPSRKLNDTLAAFSSIAEVRQRHDATNDITAPTVSAAEELADSNATIDGLLKELADTETEAERESVEARLREERHRHAAIRTSLDHLHQRSSMSEVSLRIVTGKGAGVTPPSRDKGGWGVGDALHDAGHVLTIAAGVLLIGLAVLAPFALFALLFWLGNRFRVRRLRERALG